MLQTNKHFLPQVTFMLTDASRSGLRHPRSLNPSSRALSEADAKLYQDLAQASGGQAIEVSKSSLPQATVVIEDASTSALVTRKVHIANA